MLCDLFSPLEGPVSVHIFSSFFGQFGGNFPHFSGDRGGKFVILVTFWAFAGHCKGKQLEGKALGL